MDVYIKPDYRQFFVEHTGLTLDLGVCHVAYCHTFLLHLRQRIYSNLLISTFPAVGYRRHRKVYHTYGHSVDYQR